MSRTHHQFPCEGESLAATLDGASGSTGLLIVSGGNEIRAGAHNGMANLAQNIAAQGFPVFRYDRRGIGDSDGANGGFLSTEADIAAATNAFQKLYPSISKIVAFGNCDAATAIAMFGGKAGIDNQILANPWVIEEASTETDEPTAPPPSAIRARYWERLKNPRSIIDLLTGKIDVGKLIKGLGKAAKKEEASDLSKQLGQALSDSNTPAKILLAKRDTTALAFQSAWKSPVFKGTVSKSNIELHSIDSASHSFADAQSKKWLQDQIMDTLKNA